MINPKNVLKVLSDLTFDRLFDESPSIISFDEENVAMNLFRCLDSILESSSHLFETELTLDHDDEIDAEELDDIVSTTSISDDVNTTNDDDYIPVNEHNLLNNFSLDYMKRVVDFYDEMDPATGKRKRKWRTVKHIYRRVPHPSTIARFRKYIEAGGTKREKLDIIDTYSYDQFEDARHQFLCVHDNDIQRWSLEKARELNLNDFQASTNWLSHFKHRHGICNRKITKLITKKDVENKYQISEAAKDFVMKTKAFIEKTQPNLVLNSDQIGIELELHGNRTLSYSGEKSTWASIRSVGTATHSYTVQPTITMDGYVLGPLYVCLKEPSGHISENIKKKLFNAKNRYYPSRQGFEKTRFHDQKVFFTC